MLVVWGRKNSVNVQKVLWCCEEIGLNYERKEAGGAFGVVNTSEYRSLNPNRLVPTIDDDGVVLWESNAVVRYLAAKYGGGLWPEELATRADADRWMDWQQTALWPALRTVFMGLVRTPPEQRDARAIEESRVKSGDLLGILDHYLASRAFVAGDAFTMGDIPLGCAIWRWMALPIERPARPNVQRWFDALSQRSAFKSAVMLPLT